MVDGSGHVKLGDEVLEVKQWDVIRVAPNVARGFEAGPDGLEIIAAGGSKPEGGDGTRRGSLVGRLTAEGRRTSCPAHGRCERG